MMALRQKSTGKWVNSFQNLFPRIQEVEKIEDALVDDDFLEECFYDTSDLELIEVSVVPLPQKGVEEKFDFEKEYVGKSIRKHNFDADDDSLYVCHGEHERSAQCEFVRLSPHEALKLINELRAECLANQSQPSLPSVENKMLKKRIAELEHELKEITQFDEFDLIEFRTMSADVKQVKQNLEGLSVNCKDSPPSNEWLVEYLSQQAQLLEIALNKASEQEKKYHAEYEGISFGIHKQLKELKAENEMLRQSNLPSAEEDIRINEHITIHLSEFIENQKTRVNPLYVDTVGTESHERNIFIKIVEHLRQHRGWSDEQSKQEHN